ncbi:MAG: glutathione peroxidase [Rickettsiales bacterium]|nr:glutathione peroxidase [Rickettsiales bacterium]
MKFIKTLIIISMFFFSSAKAEGSSKPQDIYGFEFESIENKKIKLSDYKNKVVMIVNTACLCGLTPQFAELEKLWQKYKDKDFVLIGVPSDNFGGQELDSEKEVAEYTQKNFKITFPLTKIYNVKGKEAHPFYNFAADEVSALGTPKWNFHKYLIGKDGKIAEWYASTTTPDSEKISSKIEELLAK